MKRIISLIFVTVFAAGLICAEGSKEKNISINPDTGFPVISEKQKPYVMVSEGLAANQINRIEVLEDRGNFVWEDYMVGAWVAMETRNIKPCDSIVRLSAYYPVYHTFNGMPQNAKQMFIYAIDLFAGPQLQFDMWKYVQVNVAGGLHYMYQLTDEYYMHYLGAGALAGIELPVAKHWTIKLDGTFTLDYANLGSNRLIQPYNYSWQYHIDLGVRYSKRGAHKYSYIHSKQAVKQASEETITDQE